MIGLTRSVDCRYLAFARRLTDPTLGPGQCGQNKGYSLFLSQQKGSNIGIMTYSEDNDKRLRSDTLSDLPGRFLALVALEG